MRSPTLPTRLVLGVLLFVAALAIVMSLLRHEAKPHTVKGSDDGIQTLDSPRFDDVLARELEDSNRTPESIEITTPIQSSPEDSLLIRIVDRRSGDPVEGASVTLEGAEPLKSNERGLVRRPDSLPATGTQLQLRVEADGFAPAEILIDPARSPPLVQLRPSGLIRGLVLRDGHPVGGARVLLWPSGTMPPTAGGRLAPTAKIVESDALGYFEARQLDPTLGYSCIAGSDRFGAWPPRHDVPCGTLDVELELKPVFGVNVILIESDGAPLRVDPALKPDGIPFTCPPGTVLLPYPNPLLALAEVRGLPDRARVDARGILCTTEADRTEAGPFSFTARAPGYEATVEEVWALPFDQGSLAEHRIRLASQNAPAGKVKIEITGAEHWPETTSTSAELHLWRDGRSMRFATDNLSSAWGLLEIPYGDYEVRLLMADAANVFPADGAFSRSIRSTESTWDFDLSSLSVLSLTVSNPDGTCYSGPLSLTLLEGIPEVGKGMVTSLPIHRARAPYTIVGIASPIVTVSPSVPPPQAFGWNLPTEYPAVHLQPGTTERLELTLLD